MGDPLTIPQAVKAALQDLYGDRLAKVILYGSRARGDFHEESDWDFLVVLKDDPISPGEEVRIMGPLLARLNLLYKTWISYHPTTVKQFEKPGNLFYKNIQHEGVEV